ncbi:10475_t:CDS:2, partial [Acaulospora morrowiae]
YLFARNMKNSASRDFLSLLENPESYDVKILVGEEPDIKEFKAHSLILTCRSTYFKSALSSRWAKVENGITIFNKPNISPSVFEVLLNNEVSLIDIAIASDELQLLEVYQQLEKRLLKDRWAWKPKDIIAILQHEHFTTLYNVSIGFVCRNPKIIFESEDFFNMKEVHLITLLKCDDLEIEEIKILEYLIQWGIKNTNSILDYDITKWTPENFRDLKNTLCNCIPHVRFFQMTPSDYTKVRAYFKDILPDGLDDEIIRYFIDPDFIPSTKILPLRNYPFESSIISAKDAGLIASWIDKRETPYHYTNLPFKFRLIYRASRDGFDIENFHKNCDNQGPTLVVIKVRDSAEIVGGYNPLEWCRVKVEDSLEDDDFTDDYFNHRCETSNSFIFSLTNRAIPILSRVSSKEEAIVWCKSKGPCFGLQDLCILSSNFSNDIVCESRKYSYEEKIINRETYEIEEYENCSKGFSNFLSGGLKVIFD